VSPYRIASIGDSRAARIAAFPRRFALIQALALITRYDREDG